MPIERKREAVYAMILNGLVTAKYKFGQKLLVRDLSAETGISRQPIMSAFAELKAAGFVRITAQVGCEVVSPTTRDVNDFYLMFNRAEGVMAELAAERRTEAELLHIEQINKQISGLAPAAKSRELYRRLNLDFHNSIGASAHSPQLAERP